jgi:hypothetical protein
MHAVARVGPIHLCGVLLRYFAKAKRFPELSANDR